MSHSHKEDWTSPSLVIGWIRKISIYETKNDYVIIGSNNEETRFRILKVNRNVTNELVIIDDKHEYSLPEVLQVMNQITSQNKQVKKISAFGIIGFVRFLEGYYLILISRRRKVATIGPHSIYKIVDTTMFYIPNDPNKVNSDEIRYLKMFQNVDLSSNFYFSYSYDLSHTIQHNLYPFNYFDGELKKKNIEQQFDFSLHCDCKGEANDGKTANSKCDCNINQNYAIRTRPAFKFVWNEYLLEAADLHPDWLIHIIHGYIGQSIINEFGHPLYLTLIARRSQRFAGTRFLKRGANQDGDVANEVETEQILSDTQVINLNSGRFVSFVQMRGSVPSFWSQDISKMVPKPQISMDQPDPFCVAAGKHYNELFHRYGAPLIVLNLVKMKENRPHEALLTKELKQSVCYLNQFIPPRFHIQYRGLDMARINKAKDKNVLQNLSSIAYQVLARVGLFQSFRCRSYSKCNLSKLSQLGGLRLNSGRLLQTGIVRVNCVDCLDRTNTAAFTLGKCALAFQLYAFGLLEHPLLAEDHPLFEQKIAKKLELMFEEHGDTLALQYGGSQLVHRIKTYRKKAPLSSQSRDFMQTLSRYYSNTFSDADKQNAINLFLGVFRAYSANGTNIMFNGSLIAGSSAAAAGHSSGSTSHALQPAPIHRHIWEMPTDYYLHNPNSTRRHTFRHRTYTQWWDASVLACLPRASQLVFKGLRLNLLHVLPKEKMQQSLTCCSAIRADQLECRMELMDAKVDEPAAREGEDRRFSQPETIETLSDQSIAELKTASAERKAEAESYGRRYSAEYYEFYRPYEYSSFDQMHFFELLRGQKEKHTSGFSTVGEFNPLQMLFGGVKHQLSKSLKFSSDTSGKKESIDSSQLCSDGSSSEDESSNAADVQLVDDNVNNKKSDPKLVTPEPEVRSATQTVKPPTPKVNSLLNTRPESCLRTGLVLVHPLSQSDIDLYESYARMAKMAYGKHQNWADEALTSSNWAMGSSHSNHAQPFEAIADNRPTDLFPSASSFAATTGPLDQVSGGVSSNLSSHKIRSASNSLRVRLLRNSRERKETSDPDDQVWQLRRSNSLDIVDSGYRTESPELNEEENEFYEQYVRRGVSEDIHLKESVEKFYQDYLDMSSLQL